jgi:hypothetical protein
MRAVMRDEPAEVFGCWNEIVAFKVSGSRCSVREKKGEEESARVEGGRGKASTSRVQVRLFLF